MRKVPKDVGNIEDCKQLIKAPTSVGANYIEANEALSKKDTSLDKERRYLEQNRQNY